MRIVAVPGVNGLGVTKGVEKSYLEVLKGREHEKVDLNIENVEEQLSKIFVETKKYFDDEGVCFVGGDHSISFPLVLNFFERFSKDSKVLVFDAHPDLMAPMSEPTHEEWLRGVVDKLGVDGDRIMIVGVRRNSENVDKSEILYAKEKGIKVIYSDEFGERKDEILDFVSSGKIYCSFDIDVFDESIVDCTGYPESEGLSLELLGFLEEVKGKINYFDLVEINFDKGERGRDVVERVLERIGVR